MDNIDAALNGIDLFGEPIAQARTSITAERFDYPPFSVLNARDGWWQDRKNRWIELGIQSELGRDTKCYNIGRWAMKATDGKMSGKDISIFDPVVCELFYKWFCGPGATILDPFAGGSVRGIVAAMLGRNYHGIDLRPEQVESNRAQWEALKHLAPRIPAPVGDGLTPIQHFGGWWAKREDAAGYTTEDMPSGTKVRAFGRMVAESPEDAPLVVGCSADSLMQCYVAAAAKACGRPAAVFVPERKEPSAETRWAAAQGAEVVGVSPGYPAIYRKAAQEWAAARGGAVRWNPAISTEDTGAQVANLPAGATRIVVPCGSGAIAAGIIAGLARAGRTDVRVLLVAVSDKADLEAIVALAARADANAGTISVELVRAPGTYGDRVEAELPDGTVLDPAYAAKAMAFVQPGDILWVSGRRGGLRFVNPVADLPAAAPTWIAGDSAAELTNAPQADLVFSCPPYGDLEVYSDDPRDLSTMDYPAFLASYRAIIADSVARLRPNRFAVFVVGEFRDPKGNYRNFVGDTVTAFLDAGAHFYNETILISPVGTLAMRIEKQFRNSRKMGKTHQNILVFVKGDAKKAAEAAGVLE